MGTANFTLFAEVGGRSSVRGMVLQQAAALGREVVVLPTMRQDEPVGTVMDKTQTALLRLGAFRASLDRPA